MSTSCRSLRTSVTARSNRNPSTPISSTQYRSESITSRRTCGCDVSTELPVPVTSYIVPPVGEPVVRAVVDPAEAQRRPVEAALGGVVVDHVEDHFDARGMERGDHRLELGHLLTARTGRRERRVRREEVQRVVAPVVRQAAGRDRRLGQEVVDRQQFDRGDAELGQVVDHRRVRQTGVRAALVLRYVGMQLREALRVQLVDDRLAPGTGLLIGGGGSESATTTPTGTCPAESPSEES